MNALWYVLGVGLLLAVLVVALIKLHRHDGRCYSEDTDRYSAELIKAVHDEIMHGGTDTAKVVQTDYRYHVECDQHRR